MAKSVAKRAVKELVERAFEDDEIDRIRQARVETIAEQPAAPQSAQDSAQVDLVADKPARAVPATGTAREDLAASAVPAEPTHPSENQSASKKRRTSKRRASKRRASKAEADASKEREPLPTRTMARLLMKQERWARALLIYDQLKSEAETTNAFTDLALAAERMTAYHALAQEEEAPITWRHLRVDGSSLVLHTPGAQKEEHASGRPLHLAILCFDRSSLVEWDVQRDDRVSTGTEFRFVPPHEGDYAIAAVERDGALRWVTPMCEWRET